jgi:hypothetical protein
MVHLNAFIRNRNALHQHPHHFAKQEEIEDIRTIEIPNNNDDNSLEEDSRFYMHSYNNKI